MTSKNREFQRYAKQARLQGSTVKPPRWMQKMNRDPGWHRKETRYEIIIPSQYIEQMGGGTMIGATKIEISTTDVTKIVVVHKGKRLRIQRK